MPLILTPEVGLPLPDFENTTEAEELEFREKAHVLCRTVLHTHGGQEYVPVSDADSREAAHMFATSTIPTRPAPRPGAILKLEALLTEYDHRVVESAAQLRTYVTNRLIEESQDRDAKVRIKALELLGKIGDVGLFAEKVEVSVSQKKDSELTSAIRAKLERYMGDAHVVDATDVREEVVKPDPPRLSDIDIDKILGD